MNKNISPIQKNKNKKSLKNKKKLKSLKNKNKNKKQSGGVFLQLRDIPYRMKNVSSLNNEIYDKLPMEYKNIGSNIGTCVDFSQFFNRPF
jgi:hypothetical protein